MGIPRLAGLSKIKGRFLGYPSAITASILSIVPH